MTLEQFRDSLSREAAPEGVAAPTEALWWDAKGDWVRAHALVDDLDTPQAMAVHAYLHRKQGEAWNAEYWYKLSSRTFYRPALEDEWQALAEGLVEGLPGG
jgi:hypothetical protein